MIFIALHNLPFYFLHSDPEFPVISHVALESDKVQLLIGQPNSETINVTFRAFQSKISSCGPESERGRRTPRTHDMLVIKSIPCLQGICI
jgi:hypothetical protein